MIAVLLLFLTKKNYMYIYDKRLRDKIRQTERKKTDGQIDRKILRLKSKQPDRQTD